MRTKITILILIVSRYILPYGEIPSAKIESVTMMGMFCMFSTDCYDTDTQNHNYTPKYWWDFDYNGSQFTTDEYTTYSTIGHTFTEEREYTIALIYTDDDGVSSLIATTYIDLRPMQTCYYLKDHLGNIKMTVNEQGEVIGYDDYYPFGMVMDGRSLNTGNPDDLYKYTGKERDKESGYDYFGARFYDSRIGRWLQVDPLAEKYLNWSPYNYVLNNPLRLFDPNGEYGVDVHYDLTYYMAVRVMGYGNDRAKLVAFGNQNIDDMWQTHSINPSNWGDRSLHFSSNSSKGVIAMLSTNPEAMNDHTYGNALHSLMDVPFAHKGFSPLGHWPFHMDVDNVSEKGKLKATTKDMLKAVFENMKKRNGGKTNISFDDMLNEITKYAKSHDGNFENIQSLVGGETQENHPSRMNYKEWYDWKWGKK